MVIDYAWVSRVLTSGVVSLVLTMWIELGIGRFPEGMLNAVIRRGILGQVRKQ